MVPSPHIRFRDCQRSNVAFSPILAFLVGTSGRAFEHPTTYSRNSMLRPTQCYEILSLFGTIDRPSNQCSFRSQRHTSFTHNRHTLFTCHTSTAVNGTHSAPSPSATSSRHTDARVSAAPPSSPVRRLRIRGLSAVRRISSWRLVLLTLWLRDGRRGSGGTS